MTPVDMLADKFKAGGREDMGEALLLLDWLIQNYVLTTEELDPMATELQGELMEILDFWTPWKETV